MEAVATSGADFDTGRCKANREELCRYTGRFVVIRVKPYVTPARYRDGLAVCRRAITASKLHGPAPANAKYNQMKQ